MMENNIFISVDGNSIGKVLQKYILSNELEKLKEFSSNLTMVIQSITKYIEKENGIIYLTGGDNILACIPLSKLDSVIEKIDSIQLKDFTFSIGIGNSSIEAYLALKFAKVSQSQCIIKYYKNNFIKYNREN